VAKGFREYPRSVQAAIVASLPLAVAAFALWYWVQPLNHERTARAKQVGDLHGQNAANRLWEQRRTSLQKQIAEAETRLRLLQAMVPDQPDYDDVVRLVRAAEDASGVHVRSLSAESPVTADEYVQLPFKLRVDGTYYALVNFFDRLAQTPRITSISELSLGATMAAGRGAYTVSPSETVAADFVLSAYYNRPPGPAPPAPKQKK
jgi:type IV pilus assembly protein PilO